MVRSPSSAPTRETRVFGLAGVRGRRPRWCSGIRVATPTGGFILCFSAVPAPTLRERTDSRSPRSACLRRPTRSGGGRPASIQRAFGTPTEPWAKRLRADSGRVVRLRHPGPCPPGRKVLPRSSPSGQSDPTEMTPRNQSEFVPQPRSRNCCAKGAWASQPINNDHATDLQERNLLEWLLLLITRNPHGQMLGIRKKWHQSDGAI